MPEELPEPPSAETAAPAPSREVDLRNQSIQLPPGQVLRDLDTTQQVHGLNGATLAEIVLPTPTGSNSTGPDSVQDKRIGIIDFGDIPPEGTAILYDPVTKQAIRGIGTTRDRYALMSLNFKSPNAMAGFLTLPVGSSRTIGRTRFGDSARLGLSEEDQYLAQSHTTVTVNEAGVITIEDHSLNGTKVVLSS